MRMPLALLAALILLLAALAVFAQVAGAPEREEIRGLIARATLPQLRHPDFASLRQALDDLYRDSGYAPQWRPGGDARRTMLAELAAAPSHGLIAADYDVDWLDGEAKAIAAGDNAPERVARADVALTVSFFRLLSDLHRGRVSPARAGFKFAPGEKPLDLAALLRGGMTSGRWHEVVVAAEPSFPLYRRLEDALARYRSCRPAHARSSPAASMPASPPSPSACDSSATCRQASRHRQTIDTRARWSTASGRSRIGTA
jgi:murein L,D-transpeptidase YcbB/YkuD